jgi:hypothetical protein
MEQMRMQAELAKSATTTAEAQMQNVTMKGQVEMAKHQRDMEQQTFKAQLAGLTAELEKAKAVQGAEKDMEEMQFKYEQLYTQVALKLTEIEASSATDQDANYINNEDMIEQDDRGMYDS